MLTVYVFLQFSPSVYDKSKNKSAKEKKETASNKVCKHI